MKDIERRVGHFALYTNKVYQAATKLHRPMLDRYRLSMNALAILEVLDDNEDCNTPKEIGRILGLKSNIVYLHVDQLVTEGYLDRHTAENDRRKITLTCTRKAKTILKEAKRGREEYAELMINGISQEDLEVYKRVIRQIEENIDAYLERA